MMSLCQVYSRVNEEEDDDKSIEMLTLDELLQEIAVKLLLLVVRFSKREYESYSLMSEFVASIPQEIADPNPLENSFEKSMFINETAAPEILHFSGGTVNTNVLGEPEFLGIFLKLNC